MSRRPSVLENYRVPDLTNPINPIDAQRMVSQERMHQQEMEANRQRQKAKAQEDRDKGLDDLKITPGTSGTIYDPTGLKETQELNTEIMAFAKANPDKSIPEIKMMFAPRANRIAQYYEKAKTIKANNKVALEGLQKLGGYNLSEIDLLAQKEALIDPTTGKIRDDIDMIDVTQPYWKTAIEKNPLETTTNEGLHDYVTKAETTPSRVKVKRVDRNKGMVTDELELSVPSFIQVEKDAKGNPVISETGTYGLEPKFETLPNGTKILEEGVFKDLKNNKPSAYQRLMGEVSQFIKTNNDESDDNIALDSVEAQNIARMLAYKDIKQVWGNKGVKKYDAVVQPPAPRITINNNSGSGKDNSSIIRDVYKEINDKYESNKDKFGTDYKIPLSELSATAQGVVIKYANELTGGEITQSDVYIQKDTDGNFNIVDKETGKGIAPIDFTDVNIKVQPNTKAKVEVVKKGNEMGKPTKKTVSIGKIKSLVGTKGYEGYSEKELIEYYKSNGYDVK